MGTIIETRQLRKHYTTGDVTIEALRGVDFCVEQGAFVAIMGPSGSGKSTLLHLLGGLDRASGGDVYLAAQAYSTLNDEALTRVRRREIGFIFQFYNLLPTLSAAENVALPLILDGGFNNSRAANVRDLLALVDLDERREHKPHQLSGGQQQRVAIARALITEPKLILADEPTGNLDSAAGKTVLALLRRACDEKGQTIIMVTHDPRAAAIADRVVFLKDGQILREQPLKGHSDAERHQRLAEASALAGI